MIGVIADDLTGAAELGAVGLRHGLRAEIVRSGKPSGRADLVCVDTDSRSCEPAAAAKRAAAAAKMLRAAGAKWIYKKVDSVLRGQVTAEVEAVMKQLAAEPGAAVAGQSVAGPRPSATASISCGASRFTRPNLRATRNIRAVRRRWCGCWQRRKSFLLRVVEWRPLAGGRHHRHRRGGDAGGRARLGGLSRRRACCRRAARNFSTRLLAGGKFARAGRRAGIVEALRRPGIFHQRHLHARGAAICRWRQSGARRRCFRCRRNWRGARNSRRRAVAAVAQRVVGRVSASIRA